MKRIIQAVLTLSAAAVAAAAMAEPIYVPGSKGAPFSAVVQVGDILYVSGQIGARPDGTLPADLEGQGRQTMDNIAAVLKTQGLTMDAVFKCSVFLKDMSRWGDFNKIYVTYFKPDRLPARSALGSTGLARDAMLEVECLAYKKAP
jgi:reactive intermediate/imine deaminase